MNTTKRRWTTPTLAILGSIQDLTQGPPGGTPPGKTVGGSDAFMLKGGGGDGDLGATGS